MAISRKNRGKRSLKSANEELEDLARFPQENPNPVFRVDKDGVVLFANPACAMVMDSVRCQPGQVIPGRYRQVVTEVLESGSPRVIETESQEGIFTLAFIPILNRGYVNVYGNNITASKKAEEVLRESEEKYRIITEFTYDWEYWHSPDNKFVYMSPSCERLTGYTDTEFINDPGLYLSISHPDDRERLEKHMAEEMHHQKQVELEYRIIRRDGQERWISHACRAVRDSEGNFLGRRGSNRDITKRKEMEEALRESQRDLNRAQAVAQTGSWRLDVQRDELLWSDEVHRMFGIPKGTPMTYETFLSRIHPDDLENVDKAWQDALQGEDYDIEHRIVVGNQVKWVREKAELEFDEQGMLKGGFGTVQDITEKVQAEETIKQAARQWQETFNAIPDLISIHDKDYNIIKVNKAFADAFGMTGEQLMGKKCFEVFHKTSKPIPGCPHQQTTKTGHSTIEEIFEPTLNAYLDVSTAPIIDDNGEFTGSVHIVHDITERKKTEKMKDEFIGLVSHELRTPLTVISGSLQSAMSPGISAEDMYELIQNAAAGADSLAAILENMLELSRYQAGRLHLIVSPVGVCNVAQNVIEKLKAQGAGQRFTIDFPDGLPPVKADPMRVERILYNLVENAVKYSPEESEIKVSCRKEADFIITRVIDHGQGIAPEHREKLFELFERLAAPAFTRGVGLGLVVCKRLVEAQGGWMKIDSEPGKGSTFTFALPIRKKKKQSSRGNLSGT